MAISGSGHADVMVCHDCPSGVAHTFAHPPADWAPEDLARNDAHRRRVQRIVDAVMPTVSHAWPPAPGLPADV